MNQLLSPYSNARFIAIRLVPGEDVILTLRQKIEQYGLQAAFIVSSVGSLTDVALRFAGQENTFQITGKYEIVSFIGTLDAQGEHLHLSVSDEHGKVLGGHMMPGCTVRTTLELVIGELEKVNFTREPCPLSGYEELIITSR
ncbi:MULTISPECIES: PPC domain-containing DNA-binding protein [Providencia]|uniref:DNA-binding protein n=1 Tax=Providencia rettgeri TaxID=587 RepID=A0A3R8XTD0_PRORE|nr:MULTISPECIES: PPC domain-containing DNA-binding protein [Providencia]ELR5216781.1 DNA-binding protein [Providencia rettgeri]MBV2190700.1 DNA-binding protein [Providencia rettgeri]HEC8322541.1 DNA-binding protein [Providencia rettgeri]